MTIATDRFERVRRLVHGEAGILLGDGKQYLVESRLKPLARERGFSDLDELLEHVLSTGDAELTYAVVEAMTTNETSFLRDQHPFETLCAHVIPPLVAARQATRRLQIWSAACSTGQEPYTIAMLLHERFPQLLGWDLRILATDLSRQVLARAAAGRFSELEISRGLPPAMTARHFDRDGAHWVARPRLRRRIEFRQLNLIEPLADIPSTDVVFLRNVLIYFDKPTRTRVLEGMHRFLAPDGALFMGTGESTVGLTDRFEPAVLGRTTCFRPRAGAR